VFTVIDAMVVQPGPVVQVAEYTFVVLVGVTLMVLPLWLVDQISVPTQPMAERLTGVPTVTSVELACRLRTGCGTTVSVPTAVAEHP
jgi:hypothetical protein